MGAEDIKGALAASEAEEVESAIEPEVVLSKQEPEDFPETTFSDEISVKSRLQKYKPGGSSSKELVPYDPLQSYLAEIRRTKKLSREEEKELAIKYREHGDKQAGYDLVLANLRLVVLIAREYQRNFKNILDLVQEGNVGLLEAVKKYDPYKGVRFSTYAVYWVRAYMLRYLINNVRLVKIGTTQNQRKLFFNLRKEKAKLEKEGFVPEAKLLAERLDVKESEVIEMEQRLALPDLSVDAPVSGGSEPGDGSDYHNLLPDSTDNAEEVVLREQFNEALREAIESFKTTADEREIALIERRLFSAESETLQSISEEFGLSRERLRQIEKRLKAKLQEFLVAELGLASDGSVSLFTQVEVEDS